MKSSQTFVVTGGNAGLGLAYCRALGRESENLVLIACRDARRGEAAATELRNEGIESYVLPLDLADLASIRAFPGLLRNAGLPPLAGLICNAGVQGGDVPERTSDGFEATFGINHLGHYLLTRLLLPDFAQGARIVFVSSATHDPAAGTGLPAPIYAGAKTLATDASTTRKAGQQRYTNSKLCNLYCTYEFSRRLAASSDARLRSLRVDAFDPGMVPGTGLARTYPAALRFLWSYVLPALTLVQKNVNRPSTSAARLAALATGGMGDLAGKYISMGEVLPSSPLSYDMGNAEELWAASAAMTGLSVDLDGRPDRT